MRFIGLTEGTDIDGNKRSLGDRDSMGHIVGYIDEKGNCWENLAERDRATTAGRYMDAMIAWERGGEEGPEPDPNKIAREICRNRAHITWAVLEARESWGFVVRYREMIGRDDA